MTWACAAPGVVGHILTWDTVEGSVQYDAEGRPSDEAKLRAFACDELDALAEGRRARAGLRRAGRVVRR